ncbi:MAG: hypothetical protein Q9214_006866, partial [Letrouitia sp. 1 TL-2023]
LEAIARFDLASTFAVAESASFSQISEACGIAEDDVRRFLRFAMTDFIFKEPQKGRVTHTPASRALAEDTGLRNFVVHACAEMWPAASRTVDAMVKWPHSQEPTQTGFNLANETENPIFVEVGKNPARAERFAKAMEWFHRNERYADRHVVEGYDWSVLGHGLLVDVGGSHGTMSKTILECFPQMRCVVQDHASAIDSAEVPENLAGRIEFVAHDFFSEQNVVADVYLLRWVLHNWSDRYALMILKQLIPALNKGAKVIVVEMCLPEPGVLSLTEERQARMMDISMKQILNARERSAEDWSRLFNEADPRFQLVQIKRPQLSELSIIEFSWQDA